MRFEITSYLPSHKQHSLKADLSVEQISECLGVQPCINRPDNDYDTGGEKVSYQWDFYATDYEQGRFVLPCAIWDYKGSRWSAYGPREVFEELGLI